MLRQDKKPGALPSSSSSLLRSLSLLVGLWKSQRWVSTDLGSVFFFFFGSRMGLKVVGVDSSVGLD